MAGFAAFSSLRRVREFRTVKSMATTKDDSHGSQAEPLKWDVFVTPGIPIAMAERPAGVRETYFQAMASTLIYGTRDALLVDAFMTVEQATALADWVASKKKNLTTIYITHGPEIIGLGWALFSSDFRTPELWRRGIQST